MMKRVVLWAAALLLVLGAPAGYAKIPAAQMTPEQQVKAAEAKAKEADAAKRDAEALAKAQDRAAENFRKGKGKAVAAAAPTAGKAKKK